MIIRDYDIELHRLDKESIEMLRQWRNARHIREAMFFQKEISQEEQKNWFKRIDNEFNFYWIIHHQNKPLGLINTSDISFHGGSAYSGLFIHDPEWQNTQIPVLASLAMLDFNFRVLKLRKILAKVREDNQVAIRYNQNLGFEMQEPIEGGFVFSLKKDIYFPKTTEFRAVAGKVRSNPPKIILKQEDELCLPELCEYLREEPFLEGGYTLVEGSEEKQSRYEHQGTQQHDE